MPPLTQYPPQWYTHHSPGPQGLITRHHCRVTGRTPSVQPSAPIIHPFREVRSDINRSSFASAFAHPLMGIVCKRVFIWIFEMAFHILIQRSTPSLFKRFLFHFSGLFFTKNNSSFLSGTAVPSQLGTATGPPSEDPCLQSTVQANGLFSDPFLHPMTGRKAPP